MIPNMNLSQAKERSIEPGGYVLRVLGAEVDTKYNRLQLKVDITEGLNQGYYSNLNEKFKFWGLFANLYMDPDVAWKFANAVEAFRQSNTDFHWEDDGENDERKMVGMYVGGILQRVHYIGNDGKEKTKVQVHHLVPVEDVRNGTFTIPDDVYKDGLGPAQAAPAGVVDTTAGMPQGFVEAADETPF